MFSNTYAHKFYIYFHNKIGLCSTTVWLSLCKRHGYQYSIILNLKVLVSHMYKMTNFNQLNLKSKHSHLTDPTDSISRIEDMHRFVHRAHSYQADMTTGNQITPFGACECYQTKVLSLTSLLIIKPVLVI